MNSARLRRETYVGPWLPEPVLDVDALGADTASEYAADLSVGLMLALERLSPLERAAFLLHDVFDVDFEEVAQLLGRNESACRQLAARARANVRNSRPRFEIAPEKGSEILRAFMGAYRTGNVDAPASLLAADAILFADGGGKRRRQAQGGAQPHLRPRTKILRLFEGVARKSSEPIAGLRVAAINRLPGCVVTFTDGRVQTIALEIVGNEIKTMYAVLNPDKLKHISTASAGQA
jgi:RNA polymerase sigma-70 factor (ECF subfamily)